MKRYPIGIQDFEKMRSGDYLYVDKTELIHSLIQNGAYYFLSRPRRFGKSLLLSTLKYIFQGRKDLCEGLWIGSSDFSFDPHPVLHFHFESLDYQGVGLEQALSIELKQQAKKYGLTLTAPTLKQQFKELIHTLGHEQGVVILVDEYDKPLVEYIDDPVKAEVNREIIRNFFSVIKSSDAYLRFFLVTGVSRFSKVSLFSDLNNLQDITLHYEYATIAGYTQDELERYFSEAFIQVAQRYHMTEEELTQQIRKWYNGYQWNVGQPVYNPFSILNFFSSQRFANYWWNTATPTFLLKLLRKNFAYDVGELTANIHVLDNLAT
ncbi:MAG: AAA family ATPase, partial [Bacteroidota bacterium]